MCEKCDEIVNVSGGLWRMSVQAVVSTSPMLLAMRETEPPEKFLPAVKRACRWIGRLQPTPDSVVLFVALSGAQSEALEAMLNG
jgi:hypothetical protein